ncbi:MAG: hypothetical protein LBL13_06145 [Bacteroidales bacterium]|nr:hypothetical protein [Bacteroidales bacterium]
MVEIVVFITSFLFISLKINTFTTGKNYRTMFLEALLLTSWTTERAFTTLLSADGM